MSPSDFLPAHEAALASSRLNSAWSPGSEALDILSKMPLSSEGHLPIDIALRSKVAIMTSLISCAVSTIN